MGEHLILSKDDDPQKVRPGPGTPLVRWSDGNSWYKLEMCAPIATPTTSSTTQFFFDLGEVDSDSDTEDAGSVAPSSASTANSVVVMGFNSIPNTVAKLVGVFEAQFLPAPRDTEDMFETSWNLGVPRRTYVSKLVSMFEDMTSTHHLELEDESPSVVHDVGKGAATGTITVGIVGAFSGGATGTTIGAV